MSTIERIMDRVSEKKNQSLERLCAWLRIASVSTDPAYAEQCREAAGWLVKRLAECGVKGEVRETGGQPVVYGRYDGAGEGAKRILFYGHYDVQPADPVEKWKTGAFEPSVREGRIYARGATDDKGQVMCFVEAMRGWWEAERRLPVNVTVLVEGEEECGSANLDRYVKEHREELEADVVVVSDTSMWRKDVPAITYAMRGLVYFDVQLWGPERDLHSGVYGGAMANPALELVRVLGGLLDDNNRVTVEGFYDQVAELGEQEKQEWQELGFSEEEWARSIGVDALKGEEGYGVLERRWARPSCDVNGLYGGYMGEGAKTVIPSFAGAKVSFRLVANQDPVRVARGFRKWMEDRTPIGCRWKIQTHGTAHPAMVDPRSPYLAAAKRAVATGCGREPVMIRSGGTIPVVNTFKRVLGLDTLLVGFSLDEDNPHSPNEKFELSSFEMGMRTHVALLGVLGTR